MPSPLFNQLQQNQAGDSLVNRFLQFRKTFNGDPKQMVQQMLNTGRISQTQLNQYAQMANQLYQQMQGMMK